MVSLRSRPIVMGRLLYMEEEMEGTCLIVSGGDFAPLPEELHGAPCVIACDRGYVYAERLGLAPDLIVGDFDSAPPPAAGAAVKRYPSRKDDTDTMLAAREAIARGFADVAICCAFGGRLDHTLANVQTAAWLVAHGARARLYGADAEATAFGAGVARIPRREGWSLSVFALSDRCEGVTLRGVKYECENETLTNAFPLGVSNVWMAETAEISLRSGILLTLMSRLGEGEHI